MLVDLDERYGLDMPLAPLLEPSVAREFETYLENATYLGLHDVEGEACHHVLYRGANVDLQIWATTDDKPLLKKLVVTFWNVEGAPQKALVFSDWNLEADTAAYLSGPFTNPSQSSDRYGRPQVDFGREIHVAT